MKHELIQTKPNLGAEEQAVGHALELVHVVNLQARGTGVKRQADPGRQVKRNCLLRRLGRTQETGPDMT